MKRGVYFLSKKSMASFELILLFFSLFSFSYMIYQSSPEALYAGKRSDGESFFAKIFGLIKKPALIPNSCSTGRIFVKHSSNPSSKVKATRHLSAGIFLFHI